MFQGVWELHPDYYIIFWELCSEEIQCFISLPFTVLPLFCFSMSVDFMIYVFNSLPQLSGWCHSHISKEHFIGAKYEDMQTDHQRIFAEDCCWVHLNYGLRDPLELHSRTKCMCPALFCFAEQALMTWIGGIQQDVLKRGVVSRMCQ